MIKSKNTILITLALTIVMLCLVLFPPITKPDAVSLFTAGEVVHPKTYSKGIIAAAGDDEGVVTDADGNPYYYNPYDNLVMTENGLAVDGKSQPMFFDPSTNTFTNDEKEELELIQNTLDANYHLLSENGMVTSSVGITDDLFSVSVKAKNKFNPTDNEYLILCRRQEVKSSWYEFWKDTYTYVYRTVYGQDVTEFVNAPKSSSDRFAALSTVSPLFTMYAIYAAGKHVYAQYLWSAKNYYGEHSYYKERIEFFSEYITGDFALDPYTGAKLRDDTGNYIFIQNGQLVDYMRLPLIGSDAWPLYYNSEWNSYNTHNGSSMLIWDGVLMELSGFVAHSITASFSAGERYYYLNLSDGSPILIPATAKLEGTKYVYYDLNGKKISNDDISNAQPDIVDREEHWPEEFEDDDTWDKIAKFLRSLGIDVTAAELRTIFMVIMGVILLIILSPVLPLIFSGIAAFFSFLWKILYAPFKALKNRNKNKQQGSG